MMAFVKRTTKPEAGNKYYIRKANGGYSNAIKGNPTDKDCNVLSNCVGYAYGRFNEIGGYGCCKYLAPVNAENFIQYKGSCKVGQTPKVGACMVWQKGASLSGSDGAGHVAIVEEVISDTEVITSESGWGSSVPFYTKNRKKGSNGRWGAGSAYKFLGFIYNPAVPDTPAPAPTSKPETTTSDIEVGDVVTFTGNTHYANANAATGPKCTAGEAKVTAKYNGKHPYHLVATDGSKSNVHGWVDAKYVTKKSAEPFKRFDVKVTISNLNIRTGPGTNYKTVGKFTGKGVFTIVEVKDGQGSKSGWGKLYSGAGWISLDYATKLS